MAAPAMEKLPLHTIEMTKQKKKINIINIHSRQQGAEDFKLRVEDVPRFFRGMGNRKDLKKGSLMSQKINIIVPVLTGYLEGKTHN